MGLGFRWIGLVVLGGLLVTAVEAAAPPKRPAQRPPAYNRQTQARQAQNRNAFRNNQFRSPLANLQRQNAAMMNPYARAMAGMYPGYGTNPAGGAAAFTDYAIIPAEDVTVRRYRLPTKDEDGKPKTYTDQEKKELKGDDPALIGYTASYDDLKVGQTVRVTLCRKRTDPKDPDKVTYVSVGQVTGTIQALDPSSLKQFTLRVRSAAVGAMPAYGAPRPTQQQQPKKNAEVPADPDKFATLVVIYSENTANPLAANK